MALYNCTKFMKIPQRVSKFLSRHDFQLKFSKGDNSIKM